MRWQEKRTLPELTHPAVFISGFILLGELFALQEWVESRRMGTHIHPPLLVLAWGFHFFLWGAICWCLGTLLQEKVRRTRLSSAIALFVPISIFFSVAEEMVFLLVFHNLPINHPNLGYWQRVTLYLDSEFINNMVIFWCAFLLFRGIDYYQRFREQEQTAALLQVQLANAQISALRMQLNPHFLFNTMNSISSLMRTDIDAADTMLEQLGCLLRITLQRGDAKLISLRDEMEFIETYLAMQGQRYAGRVVQSVSVEPELYDALVPAMFLQPIVENAFMHGLSKIEVNGKLSLSARREGEQIKIAVINSGLGLSVRRDANRNGHGVGLANTRDRLTLHYGDRSSFAIEQIEDAQVQVTVRIPLQFAKENEHLGTLVGAE